MPKNRQETAPFFLKTGEKGRKPSVYGEACVGGFENLFTAELLLRDLRATGKKYIPSADAFVDEIFQRVARVY